MKISRSILVGVLLVAVLATSVTIVSTNMVQSSMKIRIPSPEEYFGYSIGENYKLTYWHSKVSYFRIIADLSDRVEVFEIGKTAHGRPIVLIAISSPDNIARLEYYRTISNLLSDPRRIHPDDALKLVREGKAIVLLMGDQHSPEVDWSEAVIQLVYELATKDDELTKLILENTIVLIIPSVNPDGHDIYRDWYYKYTKTTYADTSPPIWGVPVSHDINRDWFSLWIPEVRIVTSAILHWKPQVIVDNHQMGMYGYRMFVPPETDPINPNIHPLVEQLKFIIGGAVQAALQAEGLYGSTTYKIYDLFYPGYSDSSWSLRNIVSMTWEIARSPGADPIYIHPSELSTAAKTSDVFHMQPWEGGWWTLKDQIRYRLVATRALLELIAKNKDLFLLYTYTAAKDQIERGRREPPYAFLIPGYTKDPAYLCDMINNLIQLGIEVRQLRSPFTYGGRVYPAGTYVVLMDQPYRGLAKTLLEVQILPIEYWYDVTAWTYGYLWNLEVVPVNDKSILYASFTAPLSMCTPPRGAVNRPATFAYVFNRTHTGIKALNEMLRDGLIAYFYAGEARIVDGIPLEPGVILIPVNNTKPVNFTYIVSIAEKYNITIRALNTTVAPVYEVYEPLVALYWPQRSGRMSMNAGWIKLILDKYGFKYEIITCENITTVDLSRYTAVIIPDETPAARVVTGITYPLKNGIGTEGVTRLKNYVSSGGILIVFNRASPFTITYGLTPPTIKAVTGATLPGTILRVYINTTHPLGYGLTPELPVYAWGGPAFEAPKEYVVAWYPSDPNTIVMSGYAANITIIAGKAALLDIPIGYGRIILTSFDPTYRAQTHGNFLILFNALYYGKLVSNKTNG
ncbi:MAG: M14 family zinc carboxypeptidase [Desulfurococcaceae archaeon]